MENEKLERELLVQSIVEMVPVLQGESLETLKKLIKEHQVRSFLEIGTALGKTAIEVASMHPQMRVVTIERDPEMVKKARENINKSGLQDQITLIEADALDYTLEGSFDLILIDGAKSQYKAFFDRYSRNLAASGRIVSDNMEFHGLIYHPQTIRSRRTRSLIRKILEYRKFLENNREFETEWIRAGDGIAVTKRRKS